jgi:hypothetical protein
MSKDTRDALLVSAFFLGYAIVLAIINRVPVPGPVLDMSRLAFGRTQRERMIAEENRNDTVAVDGD